MLLNRQALRVCSLWRRLKKEYPLAKHWSLKFFPNKEGYCWRGRKLLDIGVCGANPSRLLLHEVAHIKSQPFGNQHNQSWFDMYLRLLKTYLPNAPLSESDKIIVKVYGLKEVS